MPSPEVPSMNGCFALRTGPARSLEFWRDNGDGTVTRLSDNLTLTSRRYDVLAARRARIVPGYDRLDWRA